MNAADVLTLLGLGAIVAAIADEVARRTSRRLPWLAAGGFLLIAASPLIPNRPVAFGFSLDDVLPVMGLVIMIPLVPWSRIRAVRWSPRRGSQIAFIGLAVMMLAGLVSAILVGAGIGNSLRLALRGSGRLVLLLAIVVCVAVLGAAPGARRWSARMIAAVGAFEAAFGLVAYFIGLPGGAGLERARPNTVLEGSIPGRLSGTIGVSPNFTAAILMMSLLVTAGLGLQAETRRERIAWWSLVVLQLAAIALTYTRVSLGLVFIALLVLIVIRGRKILLVPILAVGAVVAVLTPTVQRFLTDAPDRLALWASAWLVMVDHPVGGVGPGQMLAAVAQDPGRYRFTQFGSAWSTAHNTILLAGAETGLLGAIGAVILNSRPGHHRGPGHADRPRRSIR